MAFTLGFSTNCFLKSFALLIPSVSSNLFTVSKQSVVFASFSSSVSAKNATHQLKLNHPPRASAEGALTLFSSQLVLNSLVLSNFILELITQTWDCFCNFNISTCSPVRQIHRETVNVD